MCSERRKKQSNSELSCFSFVQFFRFITVTTTTKREKKKKKKNKQRFLLLSFLLSGVHGRHRAVRVEDGLHLLHHNGALHLL